MTDVGLSHGMDRSAMGTGPGATMAPLLPQTQVLSPWLIAMPLPLKVAWS
jgi:hypothetical protein